MKTEYKVVSVSILFGLLLWFIDSLLDYLIFYEGTFWGLLILEVPDHEIYIRIIGIIIILAFGILMSGMISRRKRVETKLERLNDILKSIYNISQLIDHEKDRDKLIKSVCDILISTRNYRNAWITLWVEGRGVLTSAESGLGEAFDVLREQLISGSLPFCARKALSQTEVLIVEEPLSECQDCPLASMHKNSIRMTVALQKKGNQYGIIAVALPSGVVIDDEELALFNTISVDLNNALLALEYEEAHKGSDRALMAARISMDFVKDMYYLIDSTGSIIDVNDKTCSKLGYSRGEMIEMKISDIDPSHSIEDFQRVWEELKQQQKSTLESSILHKDGSEKRVILNINFFEYGGHEYGCCFIDDFIDQES